ncbi:MAG: BMP family ABC transporter substrate-binding protein [Treponema sp.]|nr:BMP family ABC transporter substrate-binding protein [Treponema sp.]MCL2232202.1 BMP family ABC transporter substrate-binding protein [Treponema sp.]
MKAHFFLPAFVLLLLFFPSCRQERAWMPGMPLAPEDVMIGVIHISNPFIETGGYAFAHQAGIEEMKRNLGLEDGQLLYRTHISGLNFFEVEAAVRELIAKGANIIITTSWSHMEATERLAEEFPAVVFAHATGYRYNATNFTNFFGRIYQARFLSGILAGSQTRTNRIGYVAAWGKENSEVTGGINAFAMGVARVNPQALVYVKVINSWFDPMGEASAARALIAAGSDVIAQHSDTANPQKEAERAGVWGIGFNTDMSADAPGAVLASVIWRWGSYYTALVQSVIDGTFSTEPFFGSLQDGIIDITPPRDIVAWEPEILRIFEEERRRIESGELTVFYGVMETNDGGTAGRAGEPLSDGEIRNNMNWYYRTVRTL